MSFTKESVARTPGTPPRLEDVIVLHARRLTVLGALIVTAAAGVGVARSEPAPDHRALVSALLRLEAPQPRPPVAVEFLDDDVLAEAE